MEVWVLAIVFYGGIWLVGIPVVSGMLARKSRPKIVTIFVAILWPAVLTVILTISIIYHLTIFTFKAVPKLLSWLLRLFTPKFWKSIWDGLYNAGAAGAESLVERKEEST